MITSHMTTAKEPPTGPALSPPPCSDKDSTNSLAPGSAPHSELPSPLPISATTAKHDSLGGPDADHHEGHQTDWYAPRHGQKRDRRTHVRAAKKDSSAKFAALPIPHSAASSTKTLAASGIKACKS